MCTPIGHSLVALIIGSTVSRSKFSPHNVPRLSWAFAIFCVFSGIAPDLDFAIGWYFGSINRYHHLFTHSIAMGFVYGVLIYLIVAVIDKYRSVPAGKLRNKLGAKYYGLVGGGIYISHVGADMLTVDTSAPIGMWLFWPFSEGFFISPITPFMSVQHHIGGADMMGFLSGVFVMHNAFAVLLEIGVLLPVYLLCRYLADKAHNHENLLR